MKIILDTNFILTCIENKIDLFSQLYENFPEAELVIPERVLDELERIKENKEMRMIEREAANLALQILQKEQVKTIRLEGNVDDAIVDYALQEKNVIVASLDKGVQKAVKKKARILTIKQKKLIRLI